MYLDFKTDESYTPQKISIKVQNSFQQLQEVSVIEFEEPIGWYSFKLGPEFIKTMFVQIGILQN